mgnify:CR=1 FL=1
MYKFRYSIKTLNHFTKFRKRICLYLGMSVYNNVHYPYLADELIVTPKGAFTYGSDYIYNLGKDERAYGTEDGNSIVAVTCTPEGDFVVAEQNWEKRFITIYVAYPTFESEKVKYERFYLQDLGVEDDVYSHKMKLFHTGEHIVFAVVYRKYKHAADQCIIHSVLSRSSNSPYLQREIDVDWPPPGDHWTPAEEVEQEYGVVGFNPYEIRDFEDDDDDDDDADY